MQRILSWVPADPSDKMKTSKWTSRQDSKIVISSQPLQTMNIITNIIGPVEENWTRSVFTCPTPLPIIQWWCRYAVGTEGLAALLNRQSCKLGETDNERCIRFSATENRWTRTVHFLPHISMRKLLEIKHLEYLISRYRVRTQVSSWTWFQIEESRVREPNQNLPQRRGTSTWKEDVMLRHARNRSTHKYSYTGYGVEDTWLSNM